MVRLLPACLIVSLLLLSGQPVGGTEFFGPTPYIGLVDSPFASVSNFEYFFVEDFEDGLLNTPGLISNGGVVVGDLGLPSPYVDSVDSDDGVVDGSGSDGHSLWTGKSDDQAPLGRNEFIFIFDKDVLGSLPTHAGAVWTDVIDTPTGPFTDAVSFDAFNAEGVSLGVIGPEFVGGDDSRVGLTDEDRFFGVQHSLGISRIHIRATFSPNWEVDHVQYGAVRIPEPSSVSILVTMLLCVCRWRKHLHVAQ